MAHAYLAADWSRLWIVPTLMEMLNKSRSSEYVVIPGGKRLIKRFHCIPLLPIEKLPANSLSVSQMSNRFSFRQR